MSEWDPWRRYEREFWRRYDDPWYRMDYERERMSWDPYYRMEKELTDPWYRYEKQRERELWDPMFRFEKEQERLREDPWFREQYKLEHGLRIDQVADPMYIREKESGLGTRPVDYANPEYRMEMDRIRREEEEREIKESNEFMQRFFDPNWLSAEDIERQLEELKEREEKVGVSILVKKNTSLFGFFKRLFGFF